MSFLVAEKLPTEDDLSGFRGITEDALSGFRGVTDEGCPFSFQRSYRWRMPFQVSEELLTENALNGYRGVTDGESP